MSRIYLQPSLDTDPEDSLRFYDPERDDEVLFTGCYPISTSDTQTSETSEPMTITMMIRFDMMKFAVGDKVSVRKGYRYYYPGEFTVTAVDSIFTWATNGRSILKFFHEDFEAAITMTLPESYFTLDEI
jgi:hypothetical protein